MDDNKVTITKETAVSISLVGLVVFVTSFVSGIDSRTSANAGAIEAGQRQSQVMYNEIREVKAEIRALREALIVIKALRPEESHGRPTKVN